MQIELPPDLIARLQQRAMMGNGLTNAEVIRRALDSMDWLDGERQAIEEGIKAWKSGDVEEFGSFDREFRHKNRIASDA